MKFNLTILSTVLLCGTAIAGETTILGGMSVFRPPNDGIYWNVNQPHDHSMNPVAWGLRYEERVTPDYSAAVQYTNFGTVRMNSLAVTADAPDAGGYDPNTGTCVGACAAIARWKMESSVQSVAFTVSRHFGNWSGEVGVNLYQTLTKGRVEYSGGGVFSYKDTTWNDAGPMVGVAYRQGPWSLRTQLWVMEGRGNASDGRMAPTAFNQQYQWTMLAGYTF